MKQQMKMRNNIALYIVIEYTWLKVKCKICLRKQIKTTTKNFKHVCEKYMRIFINFRIVTGCLNLMMNAKQRCVKITKAVLKPRHTEKNVQGTYASQGKNFFSMLVNVKLIYFGIQNQEYVKMQYKAVHASLLMCNKNIKFLKFI